MGRVPQVLKTTSDRGVVSEPCHSISITQSGKMRFCVTVAFSWFSSYWVVCLESKLQAFWVQAPGLHCCVPVGHVSSFSTKNFRVSLPESFGGMGSQPNCFSVSLIWPHTSIRSGLPGSPSQVSLPLSLCGILPGKHSQPWGTGGCSAV